MTAPSTVRGWVRIARRGSSSPSPQPSPPRRGRPPCPVAIDAIEHVDELLEESGGRLSVAALRRAVAMPRARIAALVRTWRRQHAPHVARLKWTRPGSVWAMDWTETDSPVVAPSGVPSGAVDVSCRWTLLVRDLAGSMQLAAIPAAHATAAVAAETLRALVAAHGAPLVLKTDNGSNVAEAEVREALAAMGIAHLRSPPGTPRYNGSVEAGIGSLKARLRAIASARGRPAAPTADDLEEARLEANELSRPWGERGPTPGERWKTRRHAAAAEREALAAAIASASREETLKLWRRRAEGGNAEISVCAAEADAILNSLDATDRATVARRAIRRALEAHGYLISRRTAISSTHLHD
ncbi:MAG: transposase family protein [Phycisphaerae bacterium]|nr:transposase family protein [Phycisphaerae bacterium]